MSATCYKPNGQLVKAGGIHIPGCQPCAVENHDSCVCETPAMRRADFGQRLERLERNVSRLMQFAVRSPTFRESLKRDCEMDDRVHVGYVVDCIDDLCHATDEGSLDDDEVLL